MNNSIESIIESILTLFGISSAPVTVSDFLWDVIIIIVGFFIIKWIMIFVITLFKEMLKMG